MTFQPKGPRVSSTLMLGGSDSDALEGIAISSGGNAIVTGLTASSDFLARAGFRSVHSGGRFDIVLVTVQLPQHSTLEQGAK